MRTNVLKKNANKTSNKWHLQISKQIWGDKMKAPTAIVTWMNLLWLTFIVLHKTVHSQWDKAMSYDTDMTKIGPINIYKLFWIKTNGEHRSKFL